MPDFSEILKIAVEQQDWQLICGVYTNITGEALAIAETKTEEEAKNDFINDYYRTLTWDSFGGSPIAVRKQYDTEGKTTCKYTR